MYMALPSCTNIFWNVPTYKRTHHVHRAVNHVHGPGIFASGAFSYRSSSLHQHYKAKVLRIHLVSKPVTLHSVSQKHQSLWNALTTMLLFFLIIRPPFMGCQTLLCQRQLVMLCEQLSKHGKTWFYVRKSLSKLLPPCWNSSWQVKTSRLHKCQSFWSSIIIHPRKPKGIVVPMHTTLKDILL